ncbi:MULTISPECIES: type II toxin-antitoxin system VapC family toxin [Moraxella]|jgi:hypothetical protein|uniref:PIN domain-containing protein n=1 Tax=Moraxella lacunata TaxID=477 RepID=A0A1B8Q6F0_MORLA|nr:MULTISPECIES: type II toxin-antitoxin system VapC family toxin [Moraxella]MBE9578763.1 type II toxin-antitoxin system VapC family toxin [Moraxella sp. K1664]MBE9588091.1 type II toxin-antitoxin system VapC family toxin [Moraxella sp. K1630]MBE9589667.1 type II toxin-antitoxin system VapC family toxin [Moraxella sp. K127]MBE9596167.1 type II toxin-antitoxin system VapC family toxin [Moraxella sp. K2450]MDH9218616.1 type II toxin-antitoxin system VapC family toxin [Moraxella lacunata]
MIKTVIVDTNVLVRYLLNDDARQNAIANQYLDNNQITCVLPIMTFCEIDWVLRKKIKIPRTEIVEFLERLTQKPNVIFDKSLFEIGLYFLKNGGDFADGVIAYQTQNFDDAKWLTFDKNGKKLAKKIGFEIELD